MYSIFVSTHYFNFIQSVSKFYKYCSQYRTLPYINDTILLVVTQNFSHNSMKCKALSWREFDTLIISFGWDREFGKI